MRQLAHAGAAVLLLCTLSAGGADAQSLSQQTRQLPGSGGPTNIISLNPFLPLLGYFAAEYEHQVGGAASIGIAGSHIKPDDTRYTNIDVKGRLYPMESGLYGFNMGASLGLGRIRRDLQADCVAPCEIPKAFTAPSFAVELGYQWMLGPSRVTVVSVGGGAKRYLGSESNFSGINRVVPTLRLNVGYAF